MKNKSFCVLPWIHVATRPDGTVKPCCVSTNFVSKANGELYNFGRDSFDDIYNGPEFLEIRRKMIAGEPVEGCQNCYRQEESSNFSNRLRYNQTFPSPAVVAKSIQNGYRIDPVIKYMDIRFGNLCNLKCRSCMPVNSSQLNREISELEPTELLSKLYPVITEDINEWYTTDTFFDNLSTIKKNLVSVYLTGGEPTLVSGNYRFMQMMIDEGVNQNVMLAFNINLTNVQDKFLNYTNQFRKILFGCSIDGIGPLQEYLRYPSDWTLIDRNFRKIIETSSNCEIRMTPVVQISNLEFLPELFDYAEQINRDHGRRIVDIYPAILNNPSIMDIQYLPLDYKLYCWDKLSRWLATVEYQDTVFFEKMKQIEYRCRLEVDGTEKLKQFLEATLALDVNRNQTLASVNPQVWDIVSRI
jgi:sulfatase maturation enzyme AslB (radical SAM superfamily)